MNLRRLTPEGIRVFGEYIDLLPSAPQHLPPTHLLDEPKMSEEVNASQVPTRGFANRLEAGAFIHQLLESARVSDPSGDKGLWAWLSLFFFDTVCPPDVDGKRKPGELARHVPDLSSYQRYYRHLLAGPWRIYRAHRDHPERALAVLCQPVHKPGDLVEQLASRQELVTNRSLIAAATKLYVDSATLEVKRGVGGKGRGTPRRLADFCNQLDVTWDIYSLTMEDFLAKLPAEFGRFRDNL